jgi:hypothetical protein
MPVSYEAFGPNGPISPPPMPPTSPQLYNPHGQFPMERYPSPIDYYSDDDDPDLSPLLNTPPSPPPPCFTYPPPDISDPNWFMNMFFNLKQKRSRLLLELEDARADATAALAEVTIAQDELNEEFTKGQAVLDMVTQMVGPDLVRKILRHAHNKVWYGSDFDSDSSSSSGDDESHHSDDDGGDHGGDVNGDSAGGIHHSDDDRASSSDSITNHAIPNTRYRRQVSPTSVTKLFFFSPH